TSAEPSKVRYAFEHLGIDGLFTATITVLDVTRGKPYPDGYLKAAQRLQKAPERCIVFEDAISGVKAAVAAGTKCIGIGSAQTASALLEAGAAHVIPDFSAVRVETLPEGTNGAHTLSLRLDTTFALPLSST